MRIKSFAAIVYSVVGFFFFIAGLVGVYNSEAGLGAVFVIVCSITLLTINGKEFGLPDYIRSLIGTLVSIYGIYYIWC